MLNWNSFRYILFGTWGIPDYWCDTDPMTCPVDIASTASSSYSISHGTVSQGTIFVPTRTLKSTWCSESSIALETTQVPSLSDGFKTSHGFEATEFSSMVECRQDEANNGPCVKLVFRIRKCTLCNEVRGEGEECDQGHTLDGNSCELCPDAMENC